MTMQRFLGAALVTALVSALGGPARADEQDAKAILDKAIKALGGEEKLKAEVLTWKAKGELTFGDNTNEFTSRTTVQGLDRYRGEFEGEFGGNKFMGVTVLDGDKGWRKFGDNVMDMDADAIANEKRTIYLRVAPMTPVLLKGQGFKVEPAGEEKVGGKPTVGLKVTGPDGKDFTIHFDKESGLPVRQVAKVLGFGGDEFTQETTFGGYKEIGGIQVATKVEARRDGQKFLEQEISDVKVLDKAPADSFAEPK